VADTKTLIQQAAHRIQDEIPALKNLKLVVKLELKGRGDVQMFRVELPGPEVSKAIAGDARVSVSMPRSHFNELATEGKIADYREALEHGHIKVEGDRRVHQLIANVIAKHEARAGRRKVH